MLRLETLLKSDLIGVILGHKCTNYSSMIKYSQSCTFFWSAANSKIV